MLCHTDHNLDGLPRPRSFFRGLDEHKRHVGRYRILPLRSRTYPDHRWKTDELPHGSISRLSTSRYGCAGMRYDPSHQSGG